MGVSANLLSNRGAEALSLEFFGCRACGPGGVVDCSVRLAGSRWSTHGAEPVSVDLGSVHLSLAALASLEAKLSGWLRLPLAELATTPLESEWSIAFSPPTELSLRFGERSDTIADQKPVLTVKFDVGSLAGELHFVTDPSCLEGFVGDLRAALAAVENAEGPE